MDVWDDEPDDAEHDRAIAALSHKRSYHDAYKVGFRDAVQHHEPIAVQAGFDFGYQEAKPVAIEIGHLRALVKMIHSVTVLEGKPSDLGRLQEELDDLEIRCADQIIPAINNDDAWSQDYDTPPRNKHISDCLPVQLLQELQALKQRLETMLDTIDE